MPEKRGTKALPPSQRPRERCLSLGPEALSETELIALLLGTGRAGEDVQDLARRALSVFGSLDGLGRASAREIMALQGFGPARAALLQAALELPVLGSISTIVTEEDLRARSKHRRGWVTMQNQSQVFRKYVVNPIWACVDRAMVRLGL